jgi:hypothetical protein
MRQAFVVFMALCLTSGGVHAREWFAERRIGTGVEVVHEQGMAMASMELSPVSVLLWENNSGVGLTYAIGPRVGWNANLGGIVVRREDGDVGTRLNLLFRLSHCEKDVCLSFAHISHGSAIGIRQDAANSGLNFLYLEYRQR